MNNIDKNKTNDKKERDNKRPSHNANMFVKIVIALITFTFVLTGTSLVGMNQFFQDIFKERVKNEDGSISIPRDAPIEQNRDNPDTYVGKILGEKIRLHQQDEFNYNLAYIFQARQLNPIQKFFQTRAVYDQAINKIIGMHNAKNMDIIVTKNALIDEIGKRYYVDEEGDVNTEKMEKDVNGVNQKTKEVLDNLYFENFIQDYFAGLPISHDEAWDNYKMENTKLTLKYVDLTNTKVEDDKLKQYYETNKETYKQCKLVKIFFDKQKKADAENALKEINSNSAKFYEVGNKLKTENKIINMVYDTDFSFINNYEEAGLRGLIQKKAEGTVGESVVEGKNGWIVYMVDKLKYGDLNDPQVKQKVEGDYTQKFGQEIAKANKEKADNLYKAASESNLERAAQRYNVKLETTTNPVTFKSSIPNLNMDLTDDLNFMVNLFKSDIGKAVAPYKYSNGYMIVEVAEKTKPAKETFDELYAGLYKQNSENKSRYLEGDYYMSERKKYKYVDNFKYVFNYQMFMPKQTDQGQGPNLNIQ